MDNTTYTATPPVDIQSTTKPKQYITVLSVISCLAVVFLHSNGSFWTFEKSTSWIISNFIECFFYFGVPVFLMISGANLIDYTKRYSTATFFKKRFFRTVLPFFVWSVIALFFRIATGVIKFSDLTFRNLIFGFFNTEYISIYWFFIPMFAMYLSFPVFAHIPDEYKQSVFGYLIVVGFTVNSLLPLIFRLCNIGYNWAFTLYTCGGFIIFALIGYYVDHYTLARKWRIVIYIVGILGFFTHFLGTHFLSYKIDAIDTTFKNYENVPGLTYSTAVFVAFKYLDGTKFVNLLHKIVKPISDCTLGVYLVHFYFIIILQTYTTWDMRTLWFKFGVGLAIFFVSVGIVKLIKLVPVVRHIV